MVDAAVVRHEVYRTVRAHGLPPTIAELSTQFETGADDIRSLLQELAASRVLVLQTDSGEILMAPPFSAVPTPFLVETARHASYANCAWDALGVPIMLGQRAQISTSCGCCGDAIGLAVDCDSPPHGTDMLHFAIPARRWCDDLVFT